MTDDEPSTTSDASTDRDHSPDGGCVSRRGALAALTGLGALGLGSGTASAVEDHDHLGEAWKGDPAANYGLRVAAQSDTRFGIQGVTQASNGRGVIGRAFSSTGTTRGVIGWVDSHSDGAAALSGLASASSGRTFGFKGRSDSPDGRGTLGIATASTGQTIGLEGRTASESGTAVRGVAYADSGTTYGVTGRVTSPDGYGLYTPDDAKIDGTMATAGDWQVHVDRDPGLTLESPGEYVDDYDRDSTASGNVVIGHLNDVEDGALGVAIGGGGKEFRSSDNKKPNLVSDHFCTVGGGSQNVAGDQDGDPMSARAATVGGGRFNEAVGEGATVAGGWVNYANGDYATVGGGDDNRVTGHGGTIAGGLENRAHQERATVGGGQGNYAGAAWATVAGGVGNDAAQASTVAGGRTNNCDGLRSAIGGGYANLIDADYSTIAGGGSRNPDDHLQTQNAVYADYGTIGGGGENIVGIDDGDSNTSYADFATVAGGEKNTATGSRATVPGGSTNTATGRSSFAAGEFAAADHDHAFVWADGSDSESDPFSSGDDPNGSGVTGANTFHVKASNGARFVNSAGTTYIPSGSTGWSTASARAMKTNVDPVDPQDALAGVESLEIATWEYEGEAGDGTGVTHVGPMAGDFHDAFDVGDSDEHINSINADGVAFAAIQGLSAELDARDERIDDLEAENEQLRERLAALEDEMATIRGRDSAPADD